MKRFGFNLSNVAIYMVFTSLLWSQNMLGMESSYSTEEDTSSSEEEYVPNRNKEKVTKRKARIRVDNYQWTEELDRVFIKAVKTNSYNGKTNWNKVAKAVGRDVRGLTPNASQCLYHYENHLRPGLIKGPLKPEEEAQIDKLLKTVKDQRKWKYIGRKLKRSPAKIRSYALSKEKEARNKSIKQKPTKKRKHNVLYDSDEDIDSASTICSSSSEEDDENDESYNDEKFAAKSFKISAKKFQWTDDSNGHLRHLVEQGPKIKRGTWLMIAKNMGDKFIGFEFHPEQCRQQYVNYARSGINKDPLAPEEEKIIERLQKEKDYHNKWTVIAAELNHRTALQVKRYWLQREKDPEKYNENIPDQVPEVKPILFDLDWEN